MGAKDTRGVETSVSVAGADCAREQRIGAWTTFSGVKAAQVSTKAVSYLKQGRKLENWSWRLWHLQNLMADID